MLEGLAAGLTLGLATGTACLASCGPIYASFLMSEKRSGLQPLWVVLKLNSGRLIAYALFGAVVGMTGAAVPARVRIPLTLAGYIVFSVYLLLSVVRVRKNCTGCGTGRFLRITRSSFLLGVLTGFSPCPAFLIALATAFRSTGALNGMLLFVGFFAGTTVYMLPLALFGVLTMKDWITKAARMVAVVVAIYFGAMGIRGLATWMTNPDLRSRYALEAVDVSRISDDTAGVFFVEDSDTVFVLSFADDGSDMGGRLAADFTGGALPPLVTVEVIRENWREAVEPLPELSTVLGPAWLDDRYDYEREPWQDSLSIHLEGSRMRLFAVEYEPYCIERAAGIESFLDRYGFRCDPDSGFTYLMLNPLACGPLDCSTCDILH